MSQIRPSVPRSSSQARDLDSTASCQAETTVSLKSPQGDHIAFGFAYLHRPSAELLRYPTCARRIRARGSAELFARPLIESSDVSGFLGRPNGPPESYPLAKPDLGEGIALSRGIGSRAEGEERRAASPMRIIWRPHQEWKFVAPQKTPIQG
jgi:hypothetical protein